MKKQALIVDGPGKGSVVTITSTYSFEWSATDSLITQAPTYTRYDVHVFQRGRKSYYIACVDFANLDHQYVYHSIEESGINPIE